MTNLFLHQQPITPLETQCRDSVTESTIEKQYNCDIFVSSTRFLLLNVTRSNSADIDCSTIENFDGVGSKSNLNGNTNGVI